MSTENLACLSVSETAKCLGVSRSHLYTYIMTGYLPSFKLGGRRLVRMANLRIWIEDLERQNDLDMKFGENEEKYCDDEEFKMYLARTNQMKP